jgi:hypothetical protein
MWKQGTERSHFRFELRRCRCGRILDAGLCGVSLTTERGTTQTEVKAPKYRLSVKPKGVLEPRQQEDKLRSSYSLKSA